MCRSKASARTEGMPPRSHQIMCEARDLERVDYVLIQWDWLMLFGKGSQSAPCTVMTPLGNLVDLPPTPCSPSRGPSWIFPDPCNTSRASLLTPAVPLTYPQWTLPPTAPPSPGISHLPAWAGACNFLPLSPLILVVGSSLA